jgi:hypothetical protein
MMDVMQNWNINVPKDDLRLQQRYEAHMKEAYSYRNELKVVLGLLKQPHQNPTIFKISKSLDTFVLNYCRTCYLREQNLEKILNIVHGRDLQKQHMTNWSNEAE